MKDTLYDFVFFLFLLPLQVYVFTGFEVPLEEFA